MYDSKATKTPKELDKLVNSMGSSGISRKDFLRYAGTAGAAAATFGLISCEDEEGPTGGGNDMVNLGTGDIGVLNYAYALEQLEAAFYIQVLDTPFAGMTADEGSVFEDIRNHEIAHADFYNAAIPEANRIPGLTPNFSAINFSDRDSTVNTALIFENTGVSAYNGAGALLETPDFLVVAGKIVSVEARHASAISDIALPMQGVAQPGTIDDNGLDLVASPGDVLAAVASYIEEQIDASGLPQS